MILASSLAYISEITNYKVDMALNDQFIETTERTQSLLNFAKLTNYSVNRNHCAQGLIKIVEITTDEDIYDANGVSLKQIPILWNDPSNKDWYDQLLAGKLNTIDEDEYDRLKAETIRDTHHWIGIAYRDVDGCYFGD